MSASHDISDESRQSAHASFLKDLALLAGRDLHMPLNFEL
jgi:hypothetical protein